MDATHSKNNLMARTKSGAKLPPMLRPFFWEYDFYRLSWEKDADLITARILSRGSWKATCWLRTKLGDDNLKEWILCRGGRGLGPRHLRFWELILDLPHKKVNEWLTTGDQTFWRRHGSE
jgi:hypothetical protein